MLLFTKEHVSLIKHRIKTQTRRLWKKQRAKEGSIHLIKTKTLSKKNHGRIRIKRVWKEHLLDISEKDAQAEGGYTKEEYLKIWFEINPKSPPDPILFVVEFDYLTTRGG